jgi:hypothetical protein
MSIKQKFEQKIEDLLKKNTDFSTFTDAEVKNVSTSIAELHGELKTVESKDFSIGDLENIESFTEFATSIKARMDKIVEAERVAQEKVTKANDILGSFSVETPEVEEIVEAPKADEAEEVEKVEDVKEDSTVEAKETVEATNEDVATETTPEVVAEVKDFTPKASKKVETAGETIATVNVAGDSAEHNFSDEKELKKFIINSYANKAKRYGSNVTADKDILVSVTDTRFKEFDATSLDEFRDNFRNIVDEKTQTLATTIKAGTGACGLPEVSTNITVLGCDDTPVEDSLAVIRGDGRNWQFYAEQEFADYATLYEGGTNFYTSADDISGAKYPKECIIEGCADTATCEIEARHYCVKHSNWTVMTSPENYGAALERASNAWSRITEQYWMQKIHDKAVADGHKLGTLPYLAGDNAVNSFISTISNLVARLKSRGRFCGVTGWTLYAPSTVKYLLQEDLMRANGFANGPSINQVLATLSAEFGINVVFYIDLFGTTAAANLTAAGETTMPMSDVTGSQFMLPRQYRFALVRNGSLVKRDAGTINLGVVRTETDIENNMFGTFFEDFKNLCFLGKGTYVFDIDMCPNGVKPAEFSISCAPQPVAARIAVEGVVEAPVKETTKK